MSDPQAIADRFQIEALRGEFTNVSMMRDWDRFASLFTHDARGGSPTATSNSSAGRRSAPGSRGCEVCGTTSPLHG
jgi:hypothetical protein